MNAAIRAFGERFLDRLLYALWSQGKRNHLAAVLFLEPQRFFECVAVRLVHLKADVGFANPVSGNGQRGAFGGNLLYAHEDVHGSVPIGAMVARSSGRGPAGVEILRCAQDDTCFAASVTCRTSA